MFNCDICGKHKYWTGSVTGSTSGEWKCPSTDDEHQIVLLKREVLELKMKIEQLETDKDYLRAELGSFCEEVLMHNPNSMFAKHRLQLLDEYWKSKGLRS